MSEVNMIVAMAKNGAIGKNNSLPWRIPEDLKAFKELTMDGVLFVGKKTAENLPPLKGREVVILNRDTFPTLSDIKTSDKWEGKKLWIIGGAAIYAEALKQNIVDKVYLTFIDQEYDADTYFSFEQLNQFSKWKIVKERVLRDEAPYVVLQELDRE